MLVDYTVGGRLSADKAIALPRILTKVALTTIGDSRTEIGSELQGIPGDSIAGRIVDSLRKFVKKLQGI